MTVSPIFHRPMNTMRKGWLANYFHGWQQWSAMLSGGKKTLFDIQLSAMNCQIFSTGLSSGHYFGETDPTCATSKRPSPDRAVSGPGKICRPTHRWRAAALSARRGVLLPAARDRGCVKTQGYAKVCPKFAGGFGMGRVARLKASLCFSLEPCRPLI